MLKSPEQTERFGSNKFFTQGREIMNSPNAVPAQGQNQPLNEKNLNQSEWEAKLGAFLELNLDESQVKRYISAFSAGYREVCTVQDALQDIELIQSLSEDKSVISKLILNAEDSPGILRFKLVSRSNRLALSDVLPVLENFNLHVLAEDTFQIVDANNQSYWLHSFKMQNGSEKLLSPDTENTEKIAVAFEATFDRVWNGHIDSDTFNRLILTGALDWQEVNMLRAYRRYMRQLKLPYTSAYTAETLAKYPEITIKLVELFKLRFHPSLGSDLHQRRVEMDVYEAQLTEMLETVETLTEDKIIRQYLTLIKATLRTNFYQLDDQCQSLPYLSFKLDVNAIPESPKPRPMFEIYVFSHEIEGVHLRGGKVARGGLRWSDRLEDFRTEILGLVKAQQVKNSVIVPMGAKGGFVCRQSPASNDRQAFLDNGVKCYRIFITALLGITDNFINGQILPPQSVVRWDESDPYLVVAADKGTATFSDIANEISEQHGFWLGDAFASGGSVGYDHKKMGITAKGAWVSVQRHFREMGINVQEQDFSVVAIGDMAGDVFGNGMLCSEHICLVAAFNHLHIFIDPNPDSSASYKERQRLFTTPGTNWADYNKELISAGGGVFSRNAKSISLTTEIKQRFGIEEDSLAPNDLINAILRAEVDLLWNGGIGTYVKANTETDLEVGDRANDSLRVNGSELGAKVVGEGGNLGLTQLGRVEYALNGGRCNTDFIDNAGGVDCSDHEVNIKILLNQLVEQSVLNSEERNTLLYNMTDAVSDLVLENNYRQTQTISIAEQEASQRAVEFRRFIAFLENEGKFDRELEFIPSDEAIVERKAKNQSLTRPELSVLVSYAKLSLKEALAESDIAEDRYVASSAYTAFPSNLVSNYADFIDDHQLHKEIVATQVAGDIINRMGITFIYRMAQTTGESVENIAKAYIACRDLFKLNEQWQAIEQLDYSVDSKLQYDMFSHLVRLVRRSTRWLLRERRALLNTKKDLKRYQATAEYVMNHIGELLQGSQQSAWQNSIEKFVAAGVPESLAHYIASARYMFTTFSIAEVVARTGQPVEKVAPCYFMLGDKLELNWFSDQIVKMGVENYWQAMARESIRDELEGRQAVLVENVVSSEQVDGEGTFIDHWINRNQSYFDRWKGMTAELRCAQELDLAMFSVAIRELTDLSQASEKVVV